ncbi:MAG TPA: DUF2127 domain-containing protein [Candidatus Saccharimonadia bacterium]|nr:DUF2127 domain-containing protein [Candidatus Saccharimonadia bacterium]
MRLHFFRPKTLLDKFYEIGILIKGIDGVLELIGGVLLLALSSGAIIRITHHLVDAELAENPHSFLGTHVLHAGMQLAHGHNLFAALFLLIHGAVKVGLVACLLLNKPWAYPVGIIVLGLLLLYQLYQLVVATSFGMAALSALDALIIWLIWREWQQVTAKQASATLQ